MNQLGVFENVQLQTCVAVITYNKCIMDIT